MFGTGECWLSRICWPGRLFIIFKGFLAAETGFARSCDLDVELMKGVHKVERQQGKGVHVHFTEFP